MTEGVEAFYINEKQIQVANPFTQHSQKEVKGEEKNIIRSLLRSPRQCCVAIHHRIQVTSEDLRRLDVGGWLNDQIVNLYFKLIEKMCPYLSVLDVFFYTTIKNIEEADKFLREDTFRRDKILIPVQSDYHWCLVVIDVDDKCVKLFDSSTSPNRCLQHIRTFLETSRKCPSEWRIEKVKVTVICLSI
ncbi:sentrin-specific protease 2-like [Mercenaria mercenaria]|uniref:sentrin-specific protease 2-like n=1 Tax=Mercenaria mercenaria TaxID=6596 RepID=UPI00234FB438|nr:sentrin-specific protease 2-like [Mercenaria mercenaria]